MSRLLLLCFFACTVVFASSNKVIGIVLNQADEKDVIESQKEVYGEYGYYSTRRHYADAISELCDGVSVIFLKPDVKNIETYSDVIDGLLIPGNTPDINPDLYGEKPIMELKTEKYRNKFEMALIHELYKKKKPILGICAGNQMINVAFGGTLYQDIPTQVKGKVKHNPFHNPSVTVHDVTIASQYNKIFGEDATRFAVNSIHHQAVKDVAEGFVAIAHSDDGVVEAIQKKNYPFMVGVQWHPEMQLSRYDQNLIKSFCSAVHNGNNDNDLTPKGTIKVELLNQ